MLRRYFLYSGLILTSHHLFAQAFAKNTISRKKYTAQSPIVIDAEISASPAARAILKTIREMAQSGEIIRGGCWDYLNIAWNRAGYPHTRRQNIFTASYPNGPFADTNLIQVGDWLYHINHSYHDIEHSGLFIAWINQEKKEALMFSYAGEQRAEPARYRVYKIDQVYQIIRAK